MCAIGGCVLSIKVCRAILRDDAPESDEELQQVRDALYVIAQAWLDTGGSPECLPVPSTVQLDADDCDAITERAAMMEFDGNMDRADAERSAIALQLARRHGRLQ